MYGRCKILHYYVNLNSETLLKVQHCGWNLEPRLPFLKVDMCSVLLKWHVSYIE